MKQIKNKNNRRRLVLIVSIVILTTLLSLVLYRTITEVKAADRTWSQTDWRGGTSAQVVTTDTTTFSESSNINYNQEGTITISSKPDWNLENWLYRQKIIFDNTNTQLNINPENLIDFPIMVKLENWVNIDYSKTNDDGSEIGRASCRERV